MPLPLIPLQRLDGTPCSTADLQGRVLLVVNVASRCGFTPQYTGLEALYRRFGPRGLEILGFPCDQFGHQEPGDAEVIARFCSLDYPVSFPLMAKCEVNGAQAHPFYRWAALQRPLETPRWNFHKYLVGRDGLIAGAYASAVEPLDPKVVAAVEKELKAG